MIKVAMLKRCLLCGTPSKIDSVDVHDMTSEETYLVKRYHCNDCDSIHVYREVIDFVLDTNITEESR